MRRVEAASGRAGHGATFSASALAWAGALVGGLFGALVGLAETWLSSAAIRSPGAFADLFGYAVLIDAAVFALVGAALTLLVAGLLWALPAQVDPAWAVALGAALVSLTIGAFVLLAPAAGPSGESARPAFAREPVAGVCAGLAALAVAVLAPGYRLARRVRAVAFRVAPVLLALLLISALVSVARDLGAHGLTLAEPVPPAAAMLELPPGQSAGLTERSSDDDQTPAAGPPPDVTSAAVPAPGLPVAGRRPNVLLITIDTLRADHVGAYGYAPARTPTLDRLAADGVLFARAYTNRNGTTPAHAGIFTGAYPARHGIRSHMFDVLSPDVTTLAEAFAAEGYTTAGLYSWLAFEPAYSGLERGFHTYTDLTVNLPSYLADPRTSALAATYKRLKSVLLLPGVVDRQMAFSAEIEESLDGKADVTTDAVLLWLRQYRARVEPAGQPFFLWVHYWDPHYPYTPPEAFVTAEPDGCEGCPDGSIPTIRLIQSGTRLDEAQARHLLRYYDGEIAFVDQQVGRLLGRLAETGLDRTTLVVVMGDHGECFGDQGCWLHGFDLLAPEIHVPLIVRFPDRFPAGRRIEAVASNVDVMPTVLEYAGVAIPPSVEGRSLLPLVRGEQRGEDRDAVAELADRSIVTLVSRDWQLLIGPEETVRLYRVTASGHGREDLSASRPDAVTELGRRLGQWQAEHP